MKEKIWVLLWVVNFLVSPIGLLAKGFHEFPPGEWGSSPQQPHVTVSPDGSIYLVYGSDNTVFGAFSRDCGKTFSEPVVVTHEGVLALGMHRGPRIAATRDYVVITAIVGKQGKGRDGNLLAWRSGDRGKTWSKAVTVNDAKDSAREGLHGLAAGPGNLIFAAWLDLRALVPGQPGTELYGAVSADGGLTWQRNALLYRSPDGTICQCCHPSVAISPKGQIQVMWRNALGGKRDMYIASSSNHGKTFSAAQKLGEGSWLLKSCPMDGGDMAISPANELETVWRREDEIFVASPGKAEQLVGKGKNPVIAYGTKGRYLAWQDDASKSIVLLSPGSNEPSRLGVNSSYVDLVADPRGLVVVTWEEGEPGKKKVKVHILG